jgi:uncharacterized protein
MPIQDKLFNELNVLHELKHYLPAQGPLKDFIHHNTLHAFQNLKFHDGIHKASGMFGYKVSFSIDEFRELYNSKKINDDILERIILQRKGADLSKEWKAKMLSRKYENPAKPRIGSLRANWKKHFQLDLDSIVHPLLFRVICAYLDQGISIWNFPLIEEGFLVSIQEMEKSSFISFFKKERARKLLMDNEIKIADLLKILVGDESLFKQYLFDQQFAHPGWSGIISVLEDNPNALFDTRKASVRDLIVFELLMEIDALDSLLGKEWPPLGDKLKVRPVDLFADVPDSEMHEVLSIFQDAYEWTYYDEVFAGIRMEKKKEEPAGNRFQAMFCIDDREDSLRDYLEILDPACETFATPGFFSVEFFFQPVYGKFYTKQCPAPVTPKYLIKEIGKKKTSTRERYYNEYSHSAFGGWFISQILGFRSALRLFLNVFKSSISQGTSFSFNHMDKFSSLSIENTNPDDKENGLQIGFTIEEMAQRVESLLKSIGLVKDFAPIVYVIGHGSSSENNPHYAAYDCGACSGRPGSVNARVFCFMANHSRVRKILSAKGIDIPKETQFIGGLHDTTRDDILFYDESSLSSENLKSHKENENIFTRALDLNAKERSRRFESIDTKQAAEIIHEEVRLRSVSLYQPRPELNHASNALCIVGRRNLTRGIFLDKRAFMNSFDYKVDPEGKYLFDILKAAAPVCGGINLEYFFSRVDNQKLGAGTKLPHNVMGLFGVANGADGDLRPGLPSQMIEVHDPIRLLMIVEHYPQVVLDTIRKSAETYEWFINEWIHLAVIHPSSQEIYLFKEGIFTPYIPLKEKVGIAQDITALIESSDSEENIPVHIIS